MYATLISRGLSARTVTHCHRVLKQALRQGVKWGFLTWNVCDAVDPPRAIRKEMRTMNFLEVHGFLTAATGSSYGAFFFMSIYTGMLRSELLGLRWSSIDFKKGTLSVRETLQRVTGKGLITLPTKTANARRPINIPTEVVTLLAGLKIKQQQDSESLGILWAESGLVFRHTDLGSFSPGHG